MNQIFRIFNKLLLVFMLSVTATAAIADVQLSPFELYGLLQCNKPGYKCIQVKKGDTWSKLWPNPRQRDLVMRLNRTNVALRYRHWLLVPRSFKHLEYMSLSPFPAHRDTNGEKLLVINMKKYAFAAYDREGNLVYWGPATSGKDWCTDYDQDCKSKTGEFNIYRMQGADCRSSKYPLETKGGAEMPYCMHYFKGFAIHGSTLMGFNNRSRGCIRLFNADAKWLNQHFVTVGTKVIVQ